MKKNSWLIIISLLIITAGSIAAWSTMSRNQTTTSELDGAARQTKQADETATPPADSQWGPEPPSGHSENKETIKLKATAPYAGEATIARSFDGTWFVLTIEADLPDPPVGKVYDVYLVKRSPKMDISFLGKLTKENGVYLRAYYSTGDTPESVEVLVTEDREVEERQNQAAPQVFSGSF